jgi:hypothetical protein
MSAACLFFLAIYFVARGARLRYGRVSSRLVLVKNSVAIVLREGAKMSEATTTILSCAFLVVRGRDIVRV